MYLHIIENNEYANNFIRFINENYNSNEHIFLVTPGSGNRVKACENCLLVEKTAVRYLDTYCKSANKILIHGLFDKKLYWWILRNPKYVSKITVCIWGGDLYNNRLSIAGSRFALRARIWELIKGVTFRRIRTFVFDMPGDYCKMREWHKTKAEMIYAVYPQTLSLKDLYRIDESRQLIPERKIRVLLGNSATKTNNHLEALDLLKKYKDEDLEIYVPLAYGSESYRQEVISKGIDAFGDKFIPITDYREPYEYAKTIAQMDIAIFNNNRQQAMANIALAAFFGCKVYLRNDTTMWDYYVRESKCAFSDLVKVKEYNWEQFCAFSVQEKEKNREFFSTLWDMNKIRNMWDKVLYDSI